MSIDTFFEGRYWKGEVMYNPRKTIYKALKFGKNNWKNGFGFLEDGIVAANAAANEAGILWDLTGDGLQMGGTFIFEKGTGRVLYSHMQKSYVDIPSAKDILEALGLGHEYTDDMKAGAPPDAGISCKDCDIDAEDKPMPDDAGCDDDVCVLPGRTNSKKKYNRAVATAR